MAKEKKQSTLSNFFQPYTTKRYVVAGSVRWSIYKSLLKGVYATTAGSNGASGQQRRDEDPKEAVAVAAFDLDQTITHTKSGSPFPVSGSDWRWFNGHVKSVLEAIGQGRWSGYGGIESTNWRVVVITNQGGFVYGSGKRSEWFVERVQQIARQLDIPLRVYAATKPKKGMPDLYRKPSPEIWNEIVKDFEQEGLDVEKERSFFVGDAAGRPSDHSDADIAFARAVGVQHFLPEEFFVPETATTTLVNGDAKKKDLIMESGAVLGLANSEDVNRSSSSSSIATP